MQLSIMSCSHKKDALCVQHGDYGIKHPHVAWFLWGLGLPCRIMSNPPMMSLYDHLSDHDELLDLVTSLAKMMANGYVHISSKSMIAFDSLTK